MLLTKNEKEKLVVKLVNEGKTTRDIAKEVHISLKDIGKIIRKETGDDDVIEREKQKQEVEKEKLKRQKSLSPYAQAFQMFKDKLSLTDVAIELDAKTDVVLNFHTDYLRLLRMDGLVKIYNDLGKDFPTFFHLYRRIKKEGLSKENITELVKNQQELKFLEKRVELYNEHIGRQQLQVRQLEQVINNLKSRIGNYDSTSIS
jgi:transposase